VSKSEYLTKNTFDWEWGRECKVIRNHTLRNQVKNKEVSEIEGGILMLHIVRKRRGENTIFVFVKTLSVSGLWLRLWRKKSCVSFFVDSLVSISVVFQHWNLWPERERERERERAVMISAVQYELLRSLWQRIIIIYVWRFWNIEKRYERGIGSQPV